jgi:hypothetical protein
MVDLQRSMGCIWKIVRAGIQAGWKNSDIGALRGPVWSENFYSRDSGKNFIRADLTQVGPNMGGNYKIAKTTPCKVERTTKKDGILT